MECAEWNFYLKGIWNLSGMLDIKFKNKVSPAALYFP
jgi:hypothetical protein